MDSDNWVVSNLQGALDTWNEKMGEIVGLLTASPADFRGGGIWDAVLSIHGAVQAVALALLVLFFLSGLVKTCGSFAEAKRPEVVLKLFVRSRFDGDGRGAMPASGARDFAAVGKRARGGMEKETRAGGARGESTEEEAARLPARCRARYAAQNPQILPRDPQRRAG